MSAQEQPIGLWELAKLLSPCRARLCALWLGEIPPGGQTVKRIDSELDRKYPNIPSYSLERQKLEQEAFERRKEKRKFLAKHLLLASLPHKVRKALITGEYQIRGRRNGEGAFITLTPDALAGLDVNLSGNQLIGTTVSYEEVAVIPIHRGKGRHKGSGSYIDIDMPILKQMRGLIEDHKAKSPNDAATQLVFLAQGNSTEKSKIERLGKAYNNWKKQGFPE